MAVNMIAEIEAIRGDDKVRLQVERLDERRLELRIVNAQGLVVAMVSVDERDLRSALDNAGDV